MAFWPLLALIRSEIYCLLFSIVYEFLFFQDFSFSVAFKRLTYGVSRYKSLYVSLWSLLDLLHRLLCTIKFGRVKTIIFPNIFSISFLSSGTRSMGIVYLIMFHRSLSLQSFSSVFSVLFRVGNSVIYFKFSDSFFCYLQSVAK